MSHPHMFDLKKIKPQKLTPGGSRTSLTSVEFPILNKISLALLKVSKGCTREPHWHPNAGELAYCLKGKALMTIFSPGSGHDTFTMQPGELAFVPMGYMHHIANIGDEELQFLVAFSNKNPEDLDLSASIQSMSEHVLAATFSTKPAFVAGLKKLDKDVFITAQGPVPKPEYPFIPSHSKINIEGINPQITTKGGWVKIANSSNLTGLEDICMFSLNLNVNGVREPHWHPNADELNYVLSGRARLTILSPQGKPDTFEIGPGEGSYIPASYLHHIENIGNEDMRMGVFFSNKAANDIGLSGSFSAYSNETLASVFGLPKDYFADFTRIQEDRFVVAGGG